MKWTLLIFISLFFVLPKTATAQQPQYEVQFFNKDWKKAGARKAFYYCYLSKFKNSWHRLDYSMADRRCIAEGNYLDAACTVKHGLCQTLYENGRTKDSSYYFNNQRDGVSAGWHFSGNRRYYYEYKNGMLKDTGANWYEDGKLEERILLDKDGNGTVTGYYPNGQQRNIGKMKVGKKEGEWVFTDEDKIISQKIKYVQDSATTIVNYDEKGVETRQGLADRPATFDGGMEGWEQYLKANLKYPSKSQRKQVQGVAIIALTIDKTGKLTDVHTVYAPDELTGKEALRVVQGSPVWLPAISHNRYVEFRTMQRINFL